MGNRALLVIDRFGSGGAQTQMALLASALGDRGWDVTIVTYFENDFLQSKRHLGNAQIIALPSRGILGFRAVSALANLLRRGHWNMSIAFLIGPSVYLSIARVVSMYRGTVVVGERSAFPTGIRAFNALLPRITFAFVDKIVANSEAHAARVRRLLWLNSRKVSCVRNAVDLDWFCVKPQLTGDLRILCVARIVVGKNAIGLVRAISVLRDLGIRDVSVTWVGHVHDAEYFQLCCEEIRRLGLSGQWNWVPQTDDLREYYWASSLVVLPSFLEGLPNCICEALACGVPVAISDIGDANWLTDAGRHGITFDPHDSSSIAGAIAKFASMSIEQRSVFSSRARSFAERELSPSRLAVAYEKFCALDPVRS